MYYEFYSIERLRKLATRLHFVDGRKHDLWEGLKTTFQLFERSSVGEKLGIKPLGSGLFSPTALGILPDLKLSNEALLKVIRHLTLFENDQKNLVRVNYSDLDVEEFGSVYEGLLEYDAVFSDDNGQPVFSFVQGKGRSSSGSHYTPEELVKPLIKHSLEYIIEDKLKEKDKENALLSIKVCDVACGSGHILLSAARRIAIDLARVRTNEDQPTPTALRQSIRDVIKHCIYGVDKNPLAVELCKVALWLEAHNPGEPLGFLDHHIKCGDAIVGLAHREELERGIADEAFKTLPGDDKGIGNSFAKLNKSERKERETTGTQLRAEFDSSLQGNVQEAMEEYGIFVKLPERTPEEIETKHRAYGKFLNGKGYLFLKTMADTQVAQFFIPKTTGNKDRLVTDAEFRQILRGYKSWQSPKTSWALVVSQYQRFFHWFIEFPEVFQKGGFDCIIGNPPFLGGKKISGNFGDRYLNSIKYHFEPAEGGVDLVGYFFRRAFSITWQLGFLSLISTNTISQGDTRRATLQQIIEQGGSINFAIKSTKWPGLAAVEVALLAISRTRRGINFLANNKVQFINSFLEPTEETRAPETLFQNIDKSFIGTVVNGVGFILEPDAARVLIESNPSNAEVIKPYLTGSDINSTLDQSPSRFVINFNDWDEEYCRSNYTACYNIVLKKVKPERDKVKREKYRTLWWQYAERCANLYLKIAPLNRVLVHSRVSRTHAFAFSNKDRIFSEATVVFAFDSYVAFSILQSSINENWAWTYSSTMKGDRRYSPTEAFENFPFPQLEVEVADKLESLGKTYYELRQELMNQMKLGLTKTYNLFHTNGLNTQDVQIRSKQTREVSALALDGLLLLRKLQAELDTAVLVAYNWADIQLNHNFYEVDYLPENDRVRYTIHPDARKEILKRLLELNHNIRTNEEKMGLWNKKRSEKKVSNDAIEEKRGYGGLFGQS